MYIKYYLIYLRGWFIAWELYDSNFCSWGCHTSLFLKMISVYTLILLDDIKIAN